MAEVQISFRPGDADTRAFRDALGKFATGVTIVTCQSGRGPLGMTANSFASVSLDPPLVLWSPARASRRFASFEAAERFAIHVLGDEQHHCCRMFATEGDNFAGLDWRPGHGDVPLIEGCLARFECARYAVHDGGDHAIIVGRVTSATFREGGPLVFSEGAYGRFQELS